MQSVLRIPTTIASPISGMEWRIWQTFEHVHCTVQRGIAQANSVSEWMATRRMWRSVRCSRGKRLLWIRAITQLFQPYIEGIWNWDFYHLCTPDPISSLTSNFQYLNGFHSGNTWDSRKYLGRQRAPLMLSCFSKICENEVFVEIVNFVGFQF